MRLRAFQLKILSNNETFMELVERLLAFLLRLFAQKKRVRARERVRESNAELINCCSIIKQTFPEYIV